MPTDKSKNRDDKTSTVVCTCGAIVEATALEVLSGEFCCPKCGGLLTPSDQPDMLSDDTEMVNISDMARMAQDGVDPAVSGEWVTFPDSKRAK